MIVPTLNEEENLQNLLDSIEEQTLNNHEVIVVDGGSTDRTVGLLRDHNSKVVVEEGLPEFPSRNVGAKLAEGDILLFTCADVVFPRNLLAKVDRCFKDPDLIALTGPDFPNDSVLAGLEYGAYNFVRFIFSSFPKPTQRFSTSTNFLAIRKTAFEKVGGFLSDINGDGIMGKQLCEMGKVRFSPAVAVLISSRRFHKMGFFRFNLHYLYVLENFFPFLSKTGFLKRLKLKSKSAHRNIHLV